MEWHGLASRCLEMAGAGLESGEGAGRSWRGFDLGCTLKPPGGLSTLPVPGPPPGF